MNYTHFIYLQIGLGSMGKRRIRNLLFHGIPATHIVGFDLSASRCQEVTSEYGIQTVQSFDDAIRQFHPNVLIISTPPHLHGEYCLYAARHHLHFFVEISTTNTHYPQLLSLLKHSTIVAAPSCTYRFFTPILMMKKYIQNGSIGTPQVLIHHCGQYLPDWHPWESYKDFYVSKPESSALKEMFLYELQWISWLANTTFTHITGAIQKVSSLDMSIPDIYNAVLSSPQNISLSLVIDVIARKPLRTTRILGSEGTLEWNLPSHRIELYTAKTKRKKIIPIPPPKKRAGYAMADERMYEAEILAFLHALNGTTPFPYTLEEETSHFDLLHQLENQALQGLALKK